MNTLSVFCIRALTVLSFHLDFESVVAFCLSGTNKAHPREHAEECNRIFTQV